MLTHTKAQVSTLGEPFLSLKFDWKEVYRVLRPCIRYLVAFVAWMITFHLL